MKKPIFCFLSRAVRSACTRFGALTLGGLLAFLGVSPAISAQVTEKAEIERLGGCLRYKLDTPPRWTSFATWTPDGKGLLISDILRAKVLRYALDGRKVGELQEHHLHKEKLGKPSNIQSTKDHILIQDEVTGQLAVLSPEGILQKSIDLEGRSNADGVRLDAVYSWATDGRSLIGFGDLETENSEWFSAYVLIDLAKDGFEILERENVGSLLRELILIGSKYISTLENDSEFFFVSTENTQTMKSLQMRGASHTTQLASASSQRLLPAVQLPTGMASMPQFYSALAEKSMLAGIYSSGGDLLLLFREPETSPLAGTKWILKEASRSQFFSPRGGWILPTKSEHLLVVPGADFWAFIEKGPVIGPGEQDISSFWLVPSGLLHSSNTGSMARPQEICD